MITVLRTKPSFHSSSGTRQLALDFGRTRPLQVGGIAQQDSCFAHRALPSMCRDGVGEQQIMDLLFQPGGAAVLAGDLVDIDRSRP